ncbi:MAG: M23 family metallopeptidase, partial [Patescibacteria group bacterium]
MESLRPFKHDVLAQTTTQKSRVNRMAAAFGVMALTACSPKDPNLGTYQPQLQRVDDLPTLTLPFESGQYWAATRLYNPDNSVDSSHRDYGGDTTDDRWAMDFAQSGCDAYGELVFPLAPGTVYDVQNTPEAGYGNTVLVDHGDGFLSRYSHLSLISVEEGDELDTRSTLGQVGDTGYTLGTSCQDENENWHTGVHLHVALYKDGAGVLPEPISGMTGLEEGCWYNREGDEDNCDAGQPADYSPESLDGELSIDFFDVSPVEGVATQNETDLVWVSTISSEEKPSVTLYIQNPEDPAWSTEMETFSKESPWVYTFKKFPVKYGDYTAWVKATTDAGTLYSGSKISPISPSNFTTLEVSDVDLSPESGTEDSTEFTWEAEIIS